MNRKCVLVTGSSIGLGASIIKKYASNDYDVIITYNNHKEEALKLKDEIISKYKVNALVVKCDISNEKNIENLKNEILNIFGKLDVLVNNAGISEYKLFIDINEEDLQRMLNVNIMGTFNTTQSVLKKSMIPRKDGTIINISSIWGMVGASLEVAYSTSKAAIIGMSKALAKELAPSNITVNVVAPGAISTDMLATLSDEDMKVLTEEIPLGKIGAVEDVAATVKFLASYEARYITGQVISPNGGLVI